MFSLTLHQLEMLFHIILMVITFYIKHLTFKFYFNRKDASLLSRRIFPALQMVSNTLKIDRNETSKMLTISYRPNNCTIDISESTVRQAKSNVRT